MEVLATLVDSLKQRQLLKLVVVLGAAELAAGGELDSSALGALQAGLLRGGAAAPCHSRACSSSICRDTRLAATAESPQRPGRQ